MDANGREFQGLTGVRMAAYSVGKSPPWVSTPGRKVAPFGAAFAFSGGNALYGGGHP